MPSIVLRDLTQEEYAYLTTAAALTQSPTLGFCLYAAIEHAAVVIENSGLSGVAKPARPDSMRRRGPISEIEASAAAARVGSVAGLESDNDLLRSALFRLEERAIQQGMTREEVNAVVMGEEEPPF